MILNNEPEDEVEEEERPFLQRLLLRNIPTLLAIAAIGWIYVTRGSPPHTSHPLQTAHTATATTTPTVATPVANETSKDIPPAPPTPVIAQAPTPTPATAIDAERVAHLETQLQEQAKAIDALKSQLAEMSAFKEQVQTSAAQSSHQLSMFSAFSLLKDTVHRGEPFAAPLNQLYTLVSTNDKNSDAIIPALDKLKPYAEKGVPTYEQLQAQFDQHLAVALAPETDTSWLHNLHSLIRIRKVGQQQQGNDDEAILARAEAKLTHKDVAGAVQEMDSLSKSANAAMAPWLENANALLAGMSALDALQLAFASTPNA